MPKYILALDQGTTSSRAILFDDAGRSVTMGQQEFRQHFPQSGWVEHDPADIWDTTLATARTALSRAGASAADVVGIGIANQRETTVVWSRATGEPVHHAIVWQDRRTAAQCAELRDAGVLEQVQDTTGLLIDPYFSATKVAWILDHVDGARAAAERGELAFGTVDCYLMWRLTNGASHCTDATNASRTMLYDIHRGEWSADMLELFRVPRSMLPDVRDSAGDFGIADPEHFDGGIAIRGVAGDQQAATVGQACFEPGMAKATYGTGCFALWNTGDHAVKSRNRLLTTIAYQLDGVPTYALEGSIFIAGAAVQWMRDELGMISAAAEAAELAADADPAQQVYLVPAFVGLGAPYWDADCRGALFGLTRGTGRSEIARAALESVCYQSRDLLAAMQGDHVSGAGVSVLRVDGGMVASDWTMQRLADLLGAPVDRPSILETTALGAAYLAGLQGGVYPAPAEFAQQWSLDQRFTPNLAEAEREQLYRGWQDAVQRVLCTGGESMPAETT